jgi:glycogen(starch) synthase
MERKRVVMLVDNYVDGDSRVQKAARTMAEYGWEVHLIGRAPGRESDRYRLGESEVQRLPLRPAPLRRTLRQQVARLRFPLARKTLAEAKLHAQQIRTDGGELAQRRLEAHLGGAGRRMPLLYDRIMARLRRTWLRLRLTQTEKATEWCRIKDGRLERFEVRWWTGLMGDRAWRRLEPLPMRYELTFAAAIDGLAPDLIHAHDYKVLGVAARAVARAHAEGRTVRLVYDAHEYLPGVSPLNLKWHAGMVGYEREYMRFADAVVTVSPQIADMLQAEHDLSASPVVVLNTPPRANRVPRQWTTETGARDVRSVCGIGPDAPLMVYCGAAASRRGLHHLVAAMKLLPEVHAALVINNLETAYVDGLRKQAAEGGFTERLHLMPYVPHDVLPAFLSTADVGVHPLQTGLVNHEVGLNTKFFEFMHARLPMAISDVRVMSAEVRRLGIGEVFRFGDVNGLAAAVRTVLADTSAYTRRYAEPGFLDEYTWEAQAERYDALYRRLLAAPAYDSAPLRRTALSAFPGD